MSASIGTQYKVLNQLLKLIIKLPGQYQLKTKYMYFYDIHGMVDIWSTIQYDTLCRGLHGFPAMEKSFMYSMRIFVDYNSYHLLCLCIAKKSLRKIVIIFSISTQ